jgi:hypothetical protein
MGVSVMEMVTSTIARMMVLYAREGPGLWMMAAFWGMAFQIAIMPARWALEWGEAQEKLRHKPCKRELEEPTFPQTGEGQLLSTSKDLQWEEHRIGSATPAVQWGSVPRRLYFSGPTDNSHHLEA